MEANSEAATWEVLLEVSSGFVEGMLLGVSSDAPTEELFLETDGATLASELGLAANPLETVSGLGLEDNSGSSTSTRPEAPSKGTSISDRLEEVARAEPSRALLFGEPLAGRVSLG